ncbi:ectoine/hydroxyectoine ABC transporter substrate-binding protein EhuB [Desulforamulus aquiferis]|uniref:Ectoine/hydroxyectoine ABC transporter substrate-binding protein EhuB n=2 Tax=Desulforamulus aquiferis TaxID=1397668 RepID=A0AAW7ZF10_9FIRM|nr:ectoine/hydroxyectoine ABC transporter substrate-binding protein EhuB [Desulforamulus aquiferis]MDO7787855.1 ectoine/hydroxyectoine ABC transporter substrate-binding protein EhuB [Desulforamulus aquiferis]
MLVGCGGNTKEQGGENVKAESTLEKAKSQGYITVGFANEAPYAYATPDGKLTGEAVEVARAIFNNMGIQEMNGVLTEFGSLIPGLKANRFDVITAGMYITEPRSKEVEFANPEYTIGEAIAVKAGNPLNLHSYQDIAANSKVKIGVMAGAVEFDMVVKSGVAKEQIVTVPDQPSALAALQAGRVDVITMSGPALQTMLDNAKDSRVERVMDFTQPIIDGKAAQSFGAAAFRKEDKDFAEAYNQELEKLKQSGQLLEILKEFGFTEQEFPGDMTVEKVLSGQ